MNSRRRAKSVFAGWITLVSIVSSQLALAAPSLNSSAPELRRTFIVNPYDYPAPTEEGFQKTFDSIRAGGVEHLEIVYNLREYYNTKQNFENGMAFVDENADRLSTLQAQENTATNCILVHEDTGEPCREFFSVIYHAPGFPPVNLLEAFTKSKRAEIEKENEARKAKGQVLKNLPPVKYGMTWWDYTYSLSQLKTDTEKLMMEEYGVGTDDHMTRTILFMGAGAILAWALKGDGPALALGETKFGKGVKNFASKTKNWISKPFKKKAADAIEEAGDKLQASDLKIMMQNHLRSKLAVLEEAAGTASKEAKPWYDRLALTKINMWLNKGIYSESKVVSFITKAVTGVSRTWFNLLSSNILVGGTLHYAAANGVAYLSVLRLKWKVEPEVNSRLYTHYVLSHTLVDALRPKGVISLPGQGSGLFLPGEMMKIANPKGLAEATDKELKEAAAKMSADEVADKAQTGKDMVTQVAGPEMANAIAMGSGDSIVNAPDQLRLTKTDKALPSVRVALLEFLTKYNKRAVKVQSIKDKE